MKKHSQRAQRVGEQIQRELAQMLRDEVKGGFECGLSVKNFNDIEKGDQIEVYEIVEVSRTL